MPGGYVGGRPKDESKLSRDPKQIRNRLRRAGRTLERDMEMLYNKPMDEWDLEELARGRPRNKSGNFMGRVPGWCTPAIQREAKRRLMDVTYGSLAKYAQHAVKVIYDLMMSEEVDEKGRPLVDARTRLACAQFIVENIVGKPKAVIEVEAADMTRQLLASAIVLDDGKPQGHLQILEGEVVEDDDAGND